jgi:hypothetical protein
MRDEAGDLVAQTFRRDNGNFATQTFVRLEIQGQTGIVFLDDDAASAFNGLGPDTALRERDKLDRH